ncbi:protein DOG1-like 4 [Pyrus communis]|uniref:protein DOG1-like 4 n=1 Tax=Pyrus communis TaxID=23211 RepID=UPI0035BFC926
MANTNILDAERESFHRFFECWLDEQNQRLHDLTFAAKNNTTATTTAATNPATTTAAINTSSTSLGKLVERVVKHYEHYYEVKSRWAKQDVLGMLSPSWLSSLEDAFLWIGGWRPSMAFHLFLSKSGLQLEARVSEFIRGFCSSSSKGNLADLSSHQLTQMDQMQQRTVKEERDISEKMDKQQEAVADSSMVNLSHVITELMNAGSGDDPVAEEDPRVESALASKEQGLEEILHRADNLRLRTLKSITHILTPIQAVHFLIAAAELHLRVHDWGKEKDATTHAHSSQP